MQKVMALLAFLFFMVCHPAVGLGAGLDPGLSPHDSRYTGPTSTPCFLTTQPPPNPYTVPDGCSYVAYDPIGTYQDGTLLYVCTPGAIITVTSRTLPNWDLDMRFYRGFALLEGAGPQRTDHTLLRITNNVQSMKLLDDRTLKPKFYGSCAAEFRCCELKGVEGGRATCKYNNQPLRSRTTYGQWCPVTLKGPTPDYLGYKCSSFDQEKPDRQRKCLKEPVDCTYVLDNEKQYIDVKSCPDLLVPSDCQVKPFSGVPGDGDVKTIMCPNFTTTGEPEPITTGCYYFGSTITYVAKCPVYPNPNGDKEPYVFCKDQPVGDVCIPPPPCKYISHDGQQYINVSTCPDLAVPWSCLLKQTDTPPGGIIIDKCPSTPNPDTDSKAQGEAPPTVTTGCSYDGPSGTVYENPCPVYLDPKNDENHVFCKNDPAGGICQRCKYITGDDGRQYIDVSSCPDLAVPWSCSLKDATDTSIPGGKSINQCPKYNVTGVHPQVSTGCSYGDGSPGTVYDKECLVYPDPKDEKSHVFCKHQPVDGKCRQRCEYISHDGRQYIDVSTCPDLAVPGSCTLKSTDTPIGMRIDMCPSTPNPDTDSNTQGDLVKTGCSYGDGSAGTVFKNVCRVYPDPKDDENHVFCKNDPAGGICQRCKYITHNERQYINVSSCPDLAVPGSCTLKSTDTPITGGMSIYQCPKYNVTGVHPQVTTGCSYGDGSAGTVFTNVCRVYDPQDDNHYVFCQNQPKKGVCPPP